MIFAAATRAGHWDSFSAAVPARGVQVVLVEQLRGTAFQPYGPSISSLVGSAAWPKSSTLSRPLAA